MLNQQKMPLRLYQCGCTSGHGSLIQVWAPEDLTHAELESIKEMAALMFRVLGRSLAESDHAHLPCLGQGPIPSGDSSESESVDNTVISQEQAASKEEK